MIEPCHARIRAVTEDNSVSHSIVRPLVGCVSAIAFVAFSSTAVATPPFAPAGDAAMMQGIASQPGPTLVAPMPMVPAHAMADVPRILGAENPLAQAKELLRRAFVHSQAGELDQSRENLKAASVWLEKSARDSSNVNTREEAAKLAAEIQELEKSMQPSRIGSGKSVADTGAQETAATPATRPEQAQESTTQASAKDPATPVEGEEGSAISRFWHKSTSLVQREVDQLIHSYQELSSNQKALKYLLDAKMRLHNAEHGLFVEHQPGLADRQLAATIQDLQAAARTVNPHTRNEIQALIKDLQGLGSEAKSRKSASRAGQVSDLLQQALRQLEAARKLATPVEQAQLDALIHQTAELQQGVEEESTRAQYEASMVKLRKIVDGL